LTSCPPPPLTNTPLFVCKNGVKSLILFHSIKICEITQLCNIVVKKSIFYVQSNLSLAATQGNDKKWLLKTGGCLRQVQIRTRCQFSSYSNRLFKTGGCYSHVAAKAGLTVYNWIMVVNRSRPYPRSRGCFSYNTNGSNLTSVWFNATGFDRSNSKC
jgi:hypothetical protein